MTGRETSKRSETAENSGKYWKISTGKKKDFEEKRRILKEQNTIIKKLEPRRQRLGINIKI